MSVNMNRGILMGMVLVFAMIFALHFSNPITAEAVNNDPNNVSVKIDPTSGKLSVTGGGFTGGASAKAWEDFILKYKNFITGIAGIGAVTMVVLFIVQFLKLGASAGNPQARSQALVGVLWTGIAAAGLGAVTLIVGFFYNAIG